MFKGYLKTCIVLLFLGIASTLFSQNVGINNTGATPSANAILDLNTGNSGNRGLIVPNVTLGASLTTFSPPMANTNTASDVGMMVYNSVATNQPTGFYYWSGSAWVAVSGSATGNLNSCGSAAANYIPYFTSANTICNSTIYQLSTSAVGINTITPKNMLGVSGAVAVGSYAGSNAARAGTSLIASGQVGIGTAAPAATAMVDLTSTSLGLLPPRMTSAQEAAIANPADGLIVYNTDAQCMEFYASSVGGWVDLACACTAAPSAPGVISPDSSCLSTTNQTLSVSINQSATYYTWTVPSIVGSWSGQGGPSITVGTYTATGTGTFSVTASNACGTSAASTKTFTVYTGSPTGTLSIGSTTICSTTSNTVTISGLSNYSSIQWSAPTTICSASVISAANSANSGDGSTSLVLSGGSGGTGVVTATIANPCGSISSSTATITCYSGSPTATSLSETQTSFCSNSTPTVTINGLSNYEFIVWGTSSNNICSAACINTADLANSGAGATSLSLTGGTGGTGTINVSVENACNAIGVQLTTPTMTCYTAVPTATVSPATTSFCTPVTASDLISLTGLANYATIVWSVSSNAICSASVVTTANAANSGNGATSLTLSGGTGGTATVTATVTNSCGSITPTSSNITYTVPTITADGNGAQSGNQVNHFNITTTQTNDLVLVACNGDGSGAPGGVTAIAGTYTATVNSYANETESNNNADTYIYWFVAPTAGTYSVTVTEGSYSKYANFGLALTGFCTTPSATDFIHSSGTSVKTCSSNCTFLSSTLTETAGSYAFGSFTGYNGSTPAIPTWTNLTIPTSATGSNDAKACYGIAGQAISTAATPTITATSTSTLTDMAIYLIDIQ